MPLPNKTLCTIDDIYALPEGERAELIDGQIYAMSPPSYIHQQLVMQISKTIANYIDSNKSPCIILPAPFAVFLNEDTKTYVEPDISVICDKNKLDDRCCNGAPDWIIEIVSPSSIRMDYYTKLFKYHTTGVKEYWVVDPLKELVIVYDFAGDGENTGSYLFTDTIKVSIYKNLHITISELIK
ncbi:Uma2 family endonuclease [Anaerosporobacter sp.]|uniref:Uma2 family endonuclease n=1 Tax=Anaerosporobacter sp. TaxID=1872529 RepID=UPI00286F3430|nr:Uma2 family endonuclease [Anaerosporobacter sp.]